VNLLKEHDKTTWVPYANSSFRMRKRNGEMEVTEPKGRGKNQGKELPKGKRKRDAYQGDKGVGVRQKGVALWNQQVKWES